MRRRQVWVTAMAVVSLALAIGANTAIFSAWSAVMQHRLPVRDVGRLVGVFTQAPGIPGIGIIGVSHLDYLDYAQTPVFASSYELRPVSVALGMPGGNRGQARQVTADVVSPTYFDVLGVEAAAGRVFHAADAPADGAGALVVLSHALFESQFGGDAGVVGRTVAVNGRAFTVAGVAPAGFAGTGTLAGADLWAPVTMHAALLPGATEKYFAARNAQFFSMVARLAPGVTVAEARAAVAATGARLARVYPKADAPLTATVLPLAAVGINPNQRQAYAMSFLILLAVVGMVLLIACANVAHLLLARAYGRRREMAVRMALGASRARIARQLLGESLRLGLAAGLAGLAVAWVAQRALWMYRPPMLADAPIALGLSAGVVAFALGLAVATSVLFGLAPALTVRRTQPMLVLRDTGALAGTGRGRLRNVLLAAEVAFTTAALVMAGLFLASLRKIEASAPGFDAAHLATLRFDLAATGFQMAAPGAGEQLLAFERELMARAQQEPGVMAATLANDTPMAPNALARAYQLVGQTQLPGESMRVASVEAIAPQSFFRTMGIPLLEGRDFLPTDTTASQPVAIVNASFARREWPGRDAVGQRILFHAETAPTLIVGVAADSKYTSAEETGTELAYVPLAQEPTTALGLAVRAAGPPAAVLSEMRQAVAAVRPQLPVTAVEPAAAAIRASEWAARLGAALLALLAGLATLLAAIGVYGVAAYSVRQRWPELGIRMALGATRGDIFALVLRGGLTPVIVGVAVGAAAAVELGRAAAALLFGVSPADPRVLLGYSLLFVAVAALALAVPARGAMQADPAMVLRSGG